MIYVMDVVSDMVLYRMLAIPDSQQGPDPDRARADRGYALVEFFDRGHARAGHEADLGLFLCQYRLGDLLRPRMAEQLDRAGLDLGAGWSIQASVMRVALPWLKMLDGRGALD